MKPNFIVIGAARSGTTSLFQYLDAHPEVYMSQVKELNFFSNEKYWAKGFCWYEKNFPVKAGQYTAVGEVSPSYTKAPFTEDVVKRIHDYVPDAKLIYIVRNPVQRCLSHYLHRVQRGYETRQFSEILKSLENESFIAQGRYHFQLQRYLARFAKDQILVLSFEQFSCKTAESVADIYRFIGVDPTFQANHTDEVHNANSQIILKSGFGLKVMRFYHHHVEQRNLPYRFKKLFLGLSNIGGTDVSKPRLNPSEIKLLDDFYREDAALLNRDFGVATESWFTERSG